MAELKLPAQVGGRGRRLFDTSGYEFALATTEDDAERIVTALNERAQLAARLEARAKYLKKCNRLSLSHPLSNLQLGALTDEIDWLRAEAARLKGEQT